MTTDIAGHGKQSGEDLIGNNFGNIVKNFFTPYDLKFLHNFKGIFNVINFLDALAA